MLIKLVGSWIWNNWYVSKQCQECELNAYMLYRSNGNAWAQGPPLADSVLKIRSIDAYFNRTTVTTSISLNPSICSAVSLSSSSVVPSATVLSSSSLKITYSSSSSTVTSSSSRLVSPSSSSEASPTSSVVSSSLIPKYGRCGGIGYVGSTRCAVGSTCVYQNDFYYQCV